MPLTPAPPPPVSVPMRRLRATLRTVLRAVEESRERVVLTRRGRPVAALVPFGALAALDLLGRSIRPVNTGPVPRLRVRGPGAVEVWRLVARRWRQVGGAAWARARFHPRGVSSYIRSGGCSRTRSRTSLSHS